MVRPSSRGGVPVFSRPSAKPSRSSVVERPIAGASPTRPAGDLPFADMDQAAQEGAGGQHHGAGARFAAVGQANPGNPAVLDDQIVGLAFDHRQIGGFADRLPASRRHRACGRPGRAGPRTAGPLRRLSTRNWMPPWSATRPIRPSSASISRTRWPFAEPADRRIAGHGADRGESMGDQRGFRAHARGRGRGLRSRHGRRRSR